MAHFSLKQLGCLGTVILLLSSILAMTVLIYQGLPESTNDTTEVPTEDSNDNLLVGAYYYPWYHDSKWDEAEGFPNTPQLSEYNSRNDQVIDQHIVWAKDYGIDFFAMSWWGPIPAYEDMTLRSHFLYSSQISNIKFCILYESTDRLISDDPLNYTFKPTSDNEKIITKDFVYLADTYFNNTQYLKIDGRPVVFLYVTRCFEGWSKDEYNEQGWEDIFAKLRINMAEKGFDLYLVGDEVYWQDANDLLPFWTLDAVTSYNMHIKDDEKLPIYGRDTEGINPGFINTDELLQGVDIKYDMWQTVANNTGCDFIPDVMPGFNDSFYPDRDNPIIPRSPEFFTDYWQVALNHIDTDINMVMITSFNEWFEDTQIEPANEYGPAYLEVIKEQTQYYQKNKEE